MNNEEILKAFQDFDKRLDELEQEKKIQNEKYEEMTEEELVESLVDDYEQAYKEAVSNGIQVAIISDEKDIKGKK